MVTTGSVTARGKLEHHLHSPESKARTKPGQSQGQFQSVNMFFSNIRKQFQIHRKLFRQETEHNFNFKMFSLFKHCLQPSAVTEQCHGLQQMQIASLNLILQTKSKPKNDLDKLVVLMTNGNNVNLVEMV